MPARPVAAFALVLAALAIAGPLAAQEIPGGPRLLQVVASSTGVVLSIDSLSVARTGDSTFVAYAVYDFPADSTQQVAADRQVDAHELDCAGMRLRGRSSTLYLAGSPVSVTTDSTKPPSNRWEPAGEDELPIVQVLCQYLLGSFAASLRVTLEAWSGDDPPELINREEVARALVRNYPRSMVTARVQGAAMMRIWITAEGRADLAASRALWATRPEFAAAAMRMLEQMRFRPARLHGRPMAVWITLPITFQLWDDEAGRPRTPDRGPSGSELWGGRSSRPTRDIHPNPEPRE
jgi:TonB family protein